MLTGQFNKTPTYGRIFLEDIPLCFKYNDNIKLYMYSVQHNNIFIILMAINALTPNDHYSGRTAPLTSKRCILYIHSTNIGTEYFKHGIYSLFFPLQNAVCFITLTYIGSCIIHILYTGCAKI